MQGNKRAGFVRPGWVEDGKGAWLCPAAGGGWTSPEERGGESCSPVGHGCDDGEDRGLALSLCRPISGVLSRPGERRKDATGKKGKEEKRKSENGRWGQRLGFVSKEGKTSFPEDGSPRSFYSPRAQARERSGPVLEKGPQMFGKSNGMTGGRGGTTAPGPRIIFFFFSIS